MNRPIAISIGTATTCAFCGRDQYPRPGRAFARQLAERGIPCAGISCEPCALERLNPRTWRTTLGGEWPAGLSPVETLSIARLRHRELIKVAHPDAGGDVAHAAMINGALDQAEKELTT